MTNPRWLPTLVRARQAREDALAQQVAQARRDVLAATEAAHAEDRRLAALAQPARSSVQAFLASAVLRDAAAATRSAAVHRVGFAQQRLSSGISDLSVAARARRTVEKLSERIEAENLAAEAAGAQRELDDISITRFARGAGRPAGSAGTPTGLRGGAS